MELNTNSWHAKLYKCFFEGLPSSLCPYFWKLLLITVLLPITWVGTTMEIIRREASFFLSFLVTIMTYLVMFMCYELVIVTLNICPEHWYDYVLFTLVGLITLIGAMAAMGTTIYLIAKITEFVIEKGRDIIEDVTTKPDNTKKKYVIPEAYKAIKNKYCPRIDWYNKW
jgi:hypothetical protein